MAIAFVQKVDGVTRVASTVSGTFASNTTTGNTLIVIIYIGNDVGAPITGVTIDHGTAAFTQIISRDNASINMAVWAAANITGGITPKITVQGSGTVQEMVAYEFSGMPTTLQLDGAAIAAVGDGINLSITGSTRTNAADLLINAFEVAGAVTAGGGGTWVSYFPTIDQFGLAQYQIVNTIGIPVATGTQDSTQAWTGIIFALKAAAIPTKILIGTCTPRVIATGALSMSGSLTGSCLVKSSSIFNFLAATKPLAGNCLTVTSNTGKLFLLNPSQGICTVRVSNSGVLAARKPFDGACSVLANNAGYLLMSAALQGNCNVRLVNTGLLSQVNSLTGQCYVYSVNTDNFVVGERGICTVLCQNTGTLFTEKFVEGVSAGFANSFGVLFQSNFLSGICTARTDMVGLLDPPNNWYVRTTTQVGANGTTWNLAWTLSQLGSNWGSVLPGDTVWFAGGTYGALSVNKSGSSGNPIIIKRATANDPAPAASPGWVPATMDTQVSFSSINTGNFNFITINGNKWVPPGLPTTYGIIVPTGNGGSSVDFGVSAAVSNLSFINLDCPGPGFHSTTSETHAFLGAHGGDPIITNLLISGCRASGMDTMLKLDNWRGTTIEYTTLINCSSGNLSAVHPDTMYWYACNGVTIRYCFIANVDSESIFFDYGGQTNVTFYGNVMVQGTGASSSAIELKQGFAYGIVNLYNNTFVSWSKGVTLDSPGATLAAGSNCKNNLFFNCGLNWAQVIDHNGFSSGGSGTNTTVNATNPFVSNGTPPAGDWRLAPGSWPIGKGINLGAPFNVDMNGIANGTDLGAFQFSAVVSGKPLIGTCTGRGSNLGALIVGRKFIGTCTAHANNLATLRATKKPVGTCTARANNLGTISTPFINHLAGGCQGKMVGSGALKTSSGASWNDTDATWDSLSVTWNDVVAITALTGTATVRANCSGTLTNTVVTKQLAGVCQAKALNTGTLRISRLKGTCTVRSGNISDSITVTRRLIGTATVRGIHTGDIDSFRVLSGSCEVDAAHTGILKASKRLAGSCTARNGNVNDPLIVTKAVNGLCTVRGINTGTIKATKAFAGTCTVRGINTGDVDIPSKIVGICTVRASNSGSMRVVRSLTGTDTVRASNTGTLKSFRILAGSCTVSANHSDDFTVTKRLTGICTARTQNTGTITVTKRVLGICTVRTLNTGVLAATKRLTGPCTVSAQNSGLLKVSRFVGACTVRSVNDGVITVTRKLSGISTVRANNFGNMGAFRILAGSCTVSATNTGAIDVTRRLTGVCTVRNGNLNDPITVSKTVFGSCTVRGVHTGTIKVGKLAVGVCTVRAANLGGLRVARFAGVCTARGQNTGTIKVTRFLDGVCTARASSIGVLKSFKILVGTCTGRANNFGALTIPFAPVGLAGFCTVRAAHSVTLRVTKPLIGESQTAIKFVQFSSGSVSGTGNSVQAIFPASATVGTTLFAIITWVTAGPPGITIAGGGAINTWSQIGSTYDDAVTGRSEAVFVCRNKNGAFTFVTANFAIQVNSFYMDIMEYSNMSLLQDAVSHNSSLTSSALNTGIVSTLFDNDLLIAFEKAESAVTSPNPGWTLRGTGGAHFFGFSDQIPKVLGTFNYTGTVTAPWTASIYAFKGNSYGVAKANNTGNLISSRAFVGACTVRAQNTGSIMVVRKLAGLCTSRAAHTGNLIAITNINALSGTCTVRASNSGTIKSSRILTGTCTARTVNTGLLRQQLLTGTCATQMVNIGVLRATKPVTGVCTVRGQNTGIIRARKAGAGICTVRAINLGSLFVAGAETFVSGTCTVRSQNSGQLLTSKPITGICTVRANHTGIMFVAKRFSGICTVRGNNVGNLFSRVSLRGIATVRAQNTGLISTFKRLKGTCTVRTVASGSLDARRGPTYTMHFSIRVNNYKCKLHLK